MRAVTPPIWRAGLAGHALPGQRLQELVHRQPARVARRALGRQHVVRSARPCRRTPRWFPRRETASRSWSGVPATSRGRRSALRGVRRRSGRTPRRLLRACRDDDLAVVAPGRFGGLAAFSGSAAMSCGTFSITARPSPRGGEQPRRGFVAVLGLPDKIDRDDLRVGRLVGDDRDLGRAGEDVDADLAEQRCAWLRRRICCPARRSRRPACR